MKRILSIILFFVFLSVSGQNYNIIKSGNFIVKSGNNVVTAETDDTSYTTEANAFFAVCTGLTTAQKEAVDYLVVQLKAIDMWDSAVVVKPVVGGTAAQHAINLRNPALYNSTYSGSPTHNASGVTFPLKTDYESHGINPSTTLSKARQTLCVYSQTSPVKTDGYMIPFYASDGSTQINAFYRGNDGKPYYFLCNSTSGQGLIYDLTEIDMQGLITLTKNSAGRRIIRNAVTVETNAVTDEYGTLPTATMTSNFDPGTTTAAQTYSGYYIGNKGLEDANIATWNTLWQTFETMLSRNVP